LLVVPNKEKLGSEFEKFAPVGTLAEIDLDVSEEIDPELFINSLKEVKLKGLKRVEIVNLERRDEVWQGECQEILEKEIGEKAMNELAEKFIRHLPSILERSKLSSVEGFPHKPMVEGNIGSVIDSIVQNGREIDQATKWRILASSDLQERLELLISLPNRQKIDKEIEDKTREAIKYQQEE
jgi:ATP-dependent Lon protease